MQFSQGGKFIFSTYLIIILFLPHIPVIFCTKSLFRSTESDGGSTTVSLVSSKHILVTVLPLFFFNNCFTAGILLSLLPENLIYSVLSSETGSGTDIRFTSSFGSLSSSQDIFPSKHSIFPVSRSSANSSYRCLQK